MNADTTAEDILNSAEPLPDPTPLQAGRAPATFPVDALPTWAANYVAAESTATQTPADLAGCCVLGVLAACGGGRVVVQPRRGWREPVNAYLLPVMPPGSRKSAVISDTTRPLYQAEEELSLETTGKMVEAMMTRGIAEKAAEKAMRVAANDPGNPALTSDAISAAHSAEAIEIPVAPRLIADDVTPEAVASLLAEHGGRLAIISAEGGVFDVMAGRYNGRVPVLDVWLKGHAGDPLRVDRKGRSSEYVKNPALTLLLTVQPTVLTGIARNGEFRGRGLLARFLYCVPPDNIGHRKIGAPPVPEDIAASYSAHVRKLVADLAGWTDPAVLTMTEDAQALLLGVERAIEPKLTRDGEYGAIREWASKMVGAIVRIAGLLHLASEQEAFRTPISAETLASAVRFGGYFAEHAQAAFGLLGDSGTSDAQYLLEFLQRKAIEDFTIRSLHVELPRGRFATAEDVTSAVEVLTEHGWVSPVPAPERKGPGRKPSPAYRTHPDVETYKPVDQATQSTEYTEPTPAPADEFATESTQSTERLEAGRFVDSVDNVATSSTAYTSGRACSACGEPLPATASASVTMHARCYSPEQAA